ncbi:MAG: glycoside hydrolase family 11 protein [Chitinispirillales bacterium]|nr:glycoside hydrolase family 11 protein [Chitinispirillales bacterium]
MFACLLIAVGSSLTWSQCDTWTNSTIRNCNGYDYELWSENNAGTTTMKITGNSTNGGTFTAAWENTINILFRAGKKWGSSSTTTARSVGNITVDFDATWSSGDNVKMLGIYGWAFYPSGGSPTKDENGTARTYSNQIEYYIIQDRGSYNAAAQGTNSKKYGSATIDGIAYDFYVADRIGKCALTGNCDVNFKQYFSVPTNTSSHRTKGLVTVSKHFEEWEKAGMKIMDCPLYEVAMKVESYTGSGSSKGSANVTKNLLTIGGADTPPGNFALTAAPSPSGAGKITKTPDAASYAPNTNVSLAATANPGWKFVRWEGGATGTASPVSVNMNANKTVTAVFSQVEDGTNLIKNGAFASTDSWTLNKWQNSAGTFAVSGGNANITNITMPSGTDAGVSSLQLVQNGIPLYKDAKYRLTFDALAASARDIGVVAQMDASPWTSYFGGDASLTAAKQSFTFEFEMKNASDENGRVAFNFGNATPNVTISNVKLAYIESLSPSGPSGIEPPVTPGAFTVTFVMNSPSAAQVPAQTVALGGKATKPADPVSAGYTFDGWYTDDGTFAMLWDFGVNVVTANTTLYAKWDEDDEPTDGVISARTLTAGKSLSAVRNGLAINAASGASMTVFGLNGSVVRKQAFPGGSHMVRLGDLPTGMYLVRANVDGVKRVVRVAVR